MKDLERLRALAERSAARRSDGDRELAQDLAQEALIAAWRAPDGKTEAYYQRAIINRINECLRWDTRLGSERPGTGLAERPRMVSLDALILPASEVRDVYPSLAEEGVERHLRLLPPIDREVALSVAHGEPLDTISRGLGHGPRWGNQKWRHIKAKLRAAA